MQRLKNKEGKIAVSYMIAIVIGLILLLVSWPALSKIPRMISSTRPNCAALGVEGTCACWYEDRDCPGGTIKIKSDKCIDEGISNSNKICRDPKLLKKALAIAEKDKAFGSCCVKAPETSIFE